MGLERGAFEFGAVEYPLNAATDNSLLQDADPAVFWAIDFLTWALQNYLGDRLKSQALLQGLKLPGAVVTTASIEPTPFLLSEQFQFPLFAVYRKKDVWDEHTIAYDKSTATWEFAYVMPPLTPVQANALQPTLRAASTILRRAVHMGWDPGYRGGEIIWRTAGLQKARVTDVTYGAYNRIDTLSQYYRTIVGTIIVLEREATPEDQYDNFDGADVAIDQTIGTTEPVLLDLVDVATQAPPTITGVSPTSGSKAGGAAVTVTGTGFRVGTRPSISFGGANADAVVVVSATSATCLTPAHDAYPTELVDVTYDATDGQSATLADSFTFTTP